MAKIEIKKTESKKETVTEMKSPDGSVWVMFVTDKGVLHIAKKEK